MARRSKADAEKTRLEIERAARDCFASKGYADTTIAEIVAVAGVTKGALFHHFSSKDELFLMVWERLQLEMDAEAREAAIAARTDDNMYGAFLAGCRTFLQWATRPDYQQVVLIDGPSVLGMSKWYQADDEMGRENVRAGLRYLARQGQIPDERVESLSVLLHNALNGAGFALARNVPGITTETLLDSFESILRSLR